jgi:hypothetical protein
MLKYYIRSIELKNTTMKRACLLFLVSILSMSVFAQEGNLKSQFYFRLGTSIPSWESYGAANKATWSDTKRFGAEIEMGSIFMLNAIHLAKGMRIGINVDYISLNYHEFEVNRNSELTKYTFIDGYLGTKIGPSFSYSPVKHLVFDIYGKINPVWIGLANSHSDASDFDQTYLGYMGIKYSFGFNIRFAALITGFEYNPGSMKFKDTSSDGTGSTILGNYMQFPNDSEKSNIPSYNITIGFSF